MKEKSFQWPENWQCVQKIRLLLMNFIKINTIYSGKQSDQSYDNNHLSKHFLIIMNEIELIVIKNLNLFLFIYLSVIQGSWTNWFKIGNFKRETQMIDHQDKP